MPAFRRNRRNYAAIDNFRLAAALLIVAIHTSPLKSFHETADFLATYCFGRIAVPFFLMVTGYFVLAPYQRGSTGLGGVGKFLRKTAVLYGISTLLYIPLKIYSGNFSVHVGDWLKEIFFDGTFYHLWYLPAVIMGCILLLALLRCCSPLTISAVVFALYVVGVLGDSYYNLIAEVPVLKTVYEGMFQISSYTRNGIFFAPAFLWMGVVLANGKVRLSRNHAAAGFLISMAGMLAEGFASFYFEWQKHNSMYFMLLLVMFFLFELLLSTQGTQVKMARDLSMYIYILHPFCIVAVRGLAGALKMSELLVKQSLLHYLAVVVTSALLSLILLTGKQALSARRNYVQQGKSMD